MRKSAYNLIIAVAWVLVNVTGIAAAESTKLPTAPINIQDTESLQYGARIFTNYCIGCHSASMMRYNRLTDIGLTEAQIKSYLLPDGAKIGDTMATTMRREDGAKWFGAAPPDLSLIARSRGADYLYAYLRSFYRDDTRPTGWNNTVFPMVSMPHALWELQGEQVLKTDLKTGKQTLVLAKPGRLNQADFDQRIADLTNFLVYIGEPAQITRHQIGYGVLIFLILLLLPLAYLLKKEYWKDVH